MSVAVLRTARKKPSWTKIKRTANATPATATSVRVRSCRRLCQARGVRMSPARIAASGLVRWFEEYLDLEVDILRGDGRLVERHGHLENAAVGVGGWVDVEDGISADDRANSFRYDHAA